MNLLILSFIILAIIIVAYKYHQPKTPTLYDRLGGIFNIAMVVDHFSDALVQNPIAATGMLTEPQRVWPD